MLGKLPITLSGNKRLAYIGPRKVGVPVTRTGEKMFVTFMNKKYEISGNYAWSKR